MGGHPNVDLPWLSAITVAIAMGSAACGSRTTLTADALSSPTPTSCKVIHELAPSGASGVYTIVSQGVSIPVYCEMIVGGGGFTAFFSGTSGHDNVFAHFEKAGEQCPDPANRCLRRLPPDFTESRLFMATCGAEAITFHVNDLGLALFQHGGQSAWQPLSNVTAVAGAPVLAYATQLWTGAGDNMSWIISNDDNIPSFTPHTFASSYNYNAGWDYCNGKPDAGAVVRLYYR
jgi:hypothetical protein